MLYAGVTSAASLLLGPHGWFLFGPVLADGERVWFDPVDCSVAVSAVDLRGEEPDLDIGRTWSGRSWSFVGDRVTPLGATHAARDADGRLSSYVIAGRSTTVVRAADGTFQGLARGEVTVGRLGSKPAFDATRHPVGTEDAWGGQSGDAAYRWESGNLGSVTTAAGTTRYTYKDGALASILTADGGGAALGPGTITAAGTTWRCTVVAGGAQLDAGADRWMVLGAKREGEQRVIAPGGSTTTTLWTDGRLAGWTAPGGAVTALEWADGRLVGVASAAGRWSLGWVGDLLKTLSGAGSWTLAYDDAGTLTGQTDPVGRFTPWASVGGAVQQWGSGTARRVLTRSGADVTSIGDGGRIAVRRDGAGRILGVTDPAGDEWRLSREGGRVVDVADPGGAHWRLSWDPVGRVVRVAEPQGREVNWERAGADLVGVRVDGAGWRIGRDARGRVVTVEDPQGRRWQAQRDAMGRVQALVRPDQGTLRWDRDEAGDVVGLDELHLVRDAAGRPTAWSRKGGSGGWSWTEGGWSTVHGPGVRLKLARNPAGEVSAVELDGGASWTLDRDASGRVQRVSGPGAVTITRDSAGRVTLLDGPAGKVRVERDARGLPARVQVDTGGVVRTWSWRRDAAGRSMGVEGPGGLRLGVDRDAAGRPLLARFSTGSLARYLWDQSGVGIVLQGADDALTAVSGWSLDALGKVTRLRGESPTLLHRDPLGELVVQEGVDVWSRAPDRVEGPGGASVSWDPQGRAIAGHVPAGAPPLWGVADGDVSWQNDDAGTLTTVTGARGALTLTHDAAGRLVRWATGRPGTTTEVVRDALGRLVSVGGAEALGWESELAFAGSPRATVPDVGQARPGGGVLVDARGIPVLVAPLGLVSVAPSGLPSSSATGEMGAGSRFQPTVGGPLLGLLDAIDPLAGQSTSAPWPSPGRDPPWEVTPADSPWPEPDASSTPPWDPAAWASEAPWGDPLALLVECGLLPDGGPRAYAAPGLPWLPASAAAAIPAPLRDPSAVDLHLGVVETWVLAHARAPVVPAAPTSLSGWLSWVEANPEARLTPALALAYGAQAGGSAASGSDTITSTLLFPAFSSRD